MIKMAFIALALLLLTLMGSPAWANSCALKGQFVGSAALAAPGLNQALVTFDFFPPPECGDDTPGEVQIFSKMLGRGTAEARLKGPQEIDLRLPYVLEKNGHLLIGSEELGIVIEGLVGFVESDDAAPATGFPQPAAVNLNLSKSNRVNAFVFTASDLGDPSIGFSGAAFTTVKGSKSNTSE